MSSASAASQLLPLMHGALAALTFVASMFFARYWWLTRDRFFIWFASAFVIFTIDWVMLALDARVSELAPYFLVRLAGFVMILIAILVKNRSGKRA